MPEPDRREGAPAREWCFPFLHNYPQWETVEMGQVLSGMPLIFGVTPQSEYRPTGTWARQHRECRRCGKLKIRIEKAKG